MAARTLSLSLELLVGDGLSLCLVPREVSFLLQRVIDSARPRGDCDPDPDARDPAAHESTEEARDGSGVRSWDDPLDEDGDGKGGDPEAK